jgi:hypothetical protein
MNTYSRILAALLLLGGSSAFVACGDDEDNGDDKEDAGEPNGDDDAGKEKDSGKPNDDDAGTEGDAGTEDEPEELAACPTHHNVTSTGDFCVLSAATGDEIKTDLELKPVKNKKGYLINKSVFVGEDVGGKAQPDSSKKAVTLTIAKGVTLYGADTLSFLLVNRGSKLIAEGSKSYPIVFTSGASGAAKPGRWGGVILNGRAPSNRADANGDVVGEAGTGKYSGPDAEDNSGIVKYVRIEFSGGKVDATNELNGLALQGVGRGTTIEYLHVHAGDDDGVEFFGGTVDAKHIVVTAFADDGIDWTDGWTGRVQFAIAQQWKYTNPGSGANDASNGIEADNQDMKQDATPYSKPTLSNVTLIGAPDMTAPVGGNGLNLRRATKGQLHNLLVLNFKSSGITLRASPAAPDCTTFVDNGELAMKNSRMYSATLYQPQGTTQGSTHGDARPDSAKKLFEGGTDNETLADADAAELTAPYEQSDKVDFTPKKGSPVLTGGSVPSDKFFEKVDFIGAIGEDNWLEGEWYKVTNFDQ